MLGTISDLHNVVCYQEKRTGGVPSIVYDKYMYRSEDTPVGWFGFDMRKGDKRSRMSYMKHKLPDGFDLTGQRICKIWDCGNFTFVKP